MRRAQANAARLTPFEPPLGEQPFPEQLAVGAARGRDGSRPSPIDQHGVVRAHEARGPTRDNAVLEHRAVRVSPVVRSDLRDKVMPVGPARLFHRVARPVLAGGRDSEVPAVVPLKPLEVSRGVGLG